MAKNEKIAMDSPDLLVRYEKLVNQAIRNAARDAVLKHKQAGNPVAIWRKEKVILLKPEEIDLEKI